MSTRLAVPSRLGHDISNEFPGDYFAVGVAFNEIGASDAVKTHATVRENVPEKANLSSDFLRAQRFCPNPSR